MMINLVALAWIARHLARELGMGDSLGGHADKSLPL